MTDGDMVGKGLTVGEGLADGEAEGLTVGEAPGLADGEADGEAVAEGLGVGEITGAGLAPNDFRYSTRSFISVFVKPNCRKSL